MPNLFNNYLARVWHASAEINNTRFRNYIRSYTPSLPVLDLGAYHPDLVTEKFSFLINPRITAVDINRQAISLLRRQHITAVLADVQRPFPFRSNAFAFVTANQIIEHLTSIDTFVSESYRVLRPGGKLVISTENLSSWHNLIALILGWQAFSQHISTLKNIGNPLKFISPHPHSAADHHIQIFTPLGLRELLSLHGFVDISLFGSGYIPFTGLPSRFLSFVDPTHSVFIGAVARKPT